jgi:hypothetical protein
MIEKKEDHLKDSEMSEQPETDRRSIMPGPGPGWPHQLKRPRKVSIEFDDLQGARVDIHVLIAQIEPAPYPPRFDRGTVEAVEEPAPRKDDELDRRMMDDDELDRKRMDIAKDK